MRLCELREKEVINLCDGKRLGCIMDVEFDKGSGKIEKVILVREKSAGCSEQTENM